MIANIKKITNYVAILLVSLVTFSMVQTVVFAAAPAPAAPASTTAKQEVCKGIGLTGADCNDPANTNTINDVIASAIGILSYVVGIAAVIMIMVGGVKYIMSQGDGNSVSSAKNTILYAVIGLVIAMFAQLIVRFVINRV